MSDALEKYLEYYCELDSPRFGVLVAGPWGAGKTFQVHKALDAIASRREFKSDPLNPDTPIWVSLYGVETPAALDVAIVAASDKTSHLGIGGLRLVGNLSRGIGGFFAAGAIASELAHPILRRSLAASRDRVLVLDDLERCHMPIDVILGSINHYVEDMGFKAIIIANDEKTEAELATRKEKLIGQTLRVSPSYHDALKSFLDELKEVKAREFVEKHREDVLTVFKSGKIQSLRILRHVVFDIERLYDCLTEENLKHEAAMSNLIKTFCALNALIREGALNSDDLHDRIDKYVDFKMDRDFEIDGEEGAVTPNDVERTKSYSTQFRAACMRFEAFIDITSNILNDETLRALLIDGVFEKVQIQNSLSSSGFFRSPLEQRSWWRVWHRHNRDDDEVMADVQAMEQDFIQRRFVEIPDILHMFGLRLSLANEGLLLNISADTVVDQSKGYLTDLLKEGRLEPASRHKKSGDVFDIITGAYGLGYSGQNLEATKTKFAQLFRYLLALQQRALQSAYNEFADKMLVLVQVGTENSIADLSRELVGEANEPGRYSLLPIFSGKSPQTFFDALMNLKGSLWLSVQVVLADRYYGTQLHNGLDDEIPWILGLMNLIKTAAADKELSAVRRFRLRQFADTFNTAHIERRKLEIEADSGTDS